jgi:hypothetical protein
MAVMDRREDTIQGCEWATPEFRDAERRILIAMCDGVDPNFGYFPFGSIARASGVELSLVKPLVRLLALTGEAEFQRGLWSEDGGMVGSGYGLTAKGRERALRYIAEDEQTTIHRLRNAPPNTSIGERDDD